MIEMVDMLYGITVAMIVVTALAGLMKIAGFVYDFIERKRG